MSPPHPPPHTVLSSVSIYICIFEAAHTYFVQFLAALPRALPISSSPFRSVFPFLRQLTFRLVAVFCGPTPSITNAVCTAVDGVFGDVVAYSCLPGYSLSNSGTGQRSCDSSGTWVKEDADPVCVQGEKKEANEREGNIQSHWKGLNKTKNKKNGEGWISKEETVTTTRREEEVEHNKRC